MEAASFPAKERAAGTGVQGRRRQWRWDEAGRGSGGGVRPRGGATRLTGVAAEHAYEGRHAGPATVR
jgi:hypothetical protein